MAEGDDDILGWSRDDGSFALEIRGATPLQIELGADVLEVVIQRYEDSEDTELVLLRDGNRTRIATGAIATTVQGIHGPTLAAQLPACGVDVRVRETRK